MSDDCIPPRRAALAALAALAAAATLPLLPSLCGRWSRWPPAIAVAVAVCGAAATLRRRRSPRDALMELASVAAGAAPPPELLARAERMAAKRARARPPRSQEEELQDLDFGPAPRFAVDDPEWLRHLDREGFAVVAGAAGAAQLAEAEDLLWAFLEEHTSWRRGSPATWTDAGMTNVGCVRNGIVNSKGVGQSDFLWHLRALPGVRRAFEMIWETPDLLVSFDGANVFRPWHSSIGFRKTLAGWWHVDQGRAKRGRHAIQGFVSLFDASERTGGLTVVPKSHLRHAEVVEDQLNPETDYVTVQNYCSVLQEMPRKLVCCRAGDLVLWDSRVVHANAPATRRPDSPPDRLLRAVGYVCMTPARWASRATKSQRRSAYEHWLGSTHWPHDPKFGDAGPRPPRSLDDAAPQVRALVVGSS